MNRGGGAREGRERRENLWKTGAQHERQPSLAS